MTPETATADALLPAAPPTTVTVDKAAAALSAAEQRKDIIRRFLNKRVMTGRNVSVDEAAKCLGVSPRRIRKTLDTGVLVAIPTANSNVRRVSAASVLHLIERRDSALAGRVESPVKPPPEPEEQPLGEEVKEESPETKEPEIAAKVKLEPKVNQMYWYHVAGYDTPLRSLREALGALGLNFAYTDWSSVPAKVKAKIRREKIVPPEGETDED